MTGGRFFEIDGVRSDLPDRDEILRRLTELAAARPESSHVAMAQSIIVAAGLNWAFIATDERFKLPRMRHGGLMIIGDDFGNARTDGGPGSFHAASLREVLRRSRWLCLMVGLIEDVYVEAAKTAVATDRLHAIVETSERHEAAWLAYLRPWASPRRPFLHVMSRAQGTC